MKAVEVKQLIRRGSSSKIANLLASKEDFKYEVSITVSQNAPCCIKNDGTYPAAIGWNEVKADTPLETIGESEKITDIWIKTATLGGRRRMWIK